MKLRTAIPLVALAAVCVTAAAVGFTRRAGQQAAVATWPSVVVALNHQVAPTIVRTVPPPTQMAPGDLTATHFLTPQLGYGVTSAGQVLKSTDGGLHWAVIWTHTGAPFSHLSWHGDVGVATSLTFKGNTPFVRLAITVDDGRTWHNVAAALPTSYGNMGIAQVFVRPQSAAVLWLTVSAQAYTESSRYPLLVSTDGGRTFHVDTLPDGFSATGGLAISPDGTVAVSAQHKQTAAIFMGRAGGPLQRVWEESLAPVYALDFVDAHTLLAAGGHYVKYGRKPWDAIWRLAISGSAADPHVIAARPLALLQSGVRTVDQPIVQVQALPGGLIYALTGGSTMGANLPAPGPLLVSRDGGTRFSSTPAVGTSFTAIGDRVLVAQSGLAISADQGRSWTVDVRPTDLQINGVAFASPQFGYVYTQIGTFVTRDGGRHFALEMPLQYLYAPPVFATSTVGYRLDTLGVERTTDAGVHWQPLHLPVPVQQVDGVSGVGRDFIAVSFVERIKGRMHDSLAISTDGGGHWRIVNAPFDRRQDVQIAFVSRKVGFAIAPAEFLKRGDQFPALLKTSDGGTTYETIPIGDLQWPYLPTDLATVGNTLLAAATEPAGSVVLQMNAQSGRTTAWHFGPLAPTTISMPTAKDGWMSANGRLFHTTDAGRSWREVWLNAAP